MSCFDPDALETLGFGYKDQPSTAEVQSAFHKLAAIHHPDRGGNNEAMRRLIEARDALMPHAKRTSASAARSVTRRARALENPDTRALQEFSQRVHVDLASCFLALPKIKEWGLSLDHPRAAKIARGEANRSKRAEWSPGGLSFDVAETIAASAGGTGDAKMDDLIDRCRSAAADETYAPGQILDDDQDAMIAKMMRLKAALKPRDRERLEMRFEKGMSIQEIAVALGVADKTIYAAIARMKGILRAALERSDWADAHNLLRLASGDDAPAPVVLDKTGQLGWDLLDAEVQP